MTTEARARTAEELAEEREQTCQVTAERAVVAEFELIEMAATALSEEARAILPGRQRALSAQAISTTAAVIGATLLAACRSKQMVFRKDRPSRRLPTRVILERIPLPSKGAPLVTNETPAARAGGLGAYDQVGSGEVAAGPPDPGETTPAPADLPALIPEVITDPMVALDRAQDEHIADSTTAGNPRLKAAVLRALQKMRDTK